MGDTGEQNNKQPAATQGKCGGKRNEQSRCNPMGNAEEKKK
jgi:hypothetical protein